MELIPTQIISNKNIAPEIFSMELKAPTISKTAKPGQFAMVYLDKGEYLLPRPISLCNTNPQKGTITIVYQVVGNGTKVMSEKQAGQTLKILAPLGNGFFLDNLANKNIALIGGGIGTPPLLMLAKFLKELNAKTDIYLGFRSHPILVEEFKPFSNNIFIATEDGSHGHKGYNLDLLQKNQNYDELLSCGPAPMLSALKKHALATNTPCQVSLEERMGCGIGTCVGCVVKVGESYARICCTGPIFYATEVEM